eukprot:3793341-Ditylum_brightwellii.AAC.1
MWFANRKGILSMSSGILVDRYMFQRKCTALCHGKEIPVVRVMIPPVNPDNETTNVGVSKVYVKLLIMAGILKATSGEEIDGVSISDEGADAIDRTDYHVLLQYKD